MALLAKFFGRSGQEKRMLFEAGAFLVTAKLLLVLTPFRWTAARLKKSSVKPKLKFSEGERKTAESVGWAVESVARHLPLGLVCLPQAIAARWMLTRRGLPSTLYIGVKSGEEKTVAAHAWLKAGDHVLTGNKGIQRYKVIAEFGGSSNAPDASPSIAATHFRK